MDLQQVEGAKNEGEKKAAAGGAKKDDGNVTVVLKMDMHCEGCAKKVRRAVRNFEGRQQYSPMGARELRFTPVSTRFDF